METIIEQPLNATAIPIVKNRYVIAPTQRVSHHRVRDQTQIDKPYLCPHHNLPACSYTPLK